MSTLSKAVYAAFLFAVLFCIFMAWATAWG